MKTIREFDSNYSYANARWLLKLRWVAVIGQLVTILCSVWLFNIEIPMAWAMASVIAVTLLSNLALAFWIARWIGQEPASDFNHVDPIRPWNLTLGFVLIMDIFSLTTLLFATGGPNNPFCLFFFVNLSLSALLLNRYWAWGINLLTFCCFAFLQFEHHDIPQLNSGLESIRSTGVISILHMGLLVAFGTCSSVIVYFMTRLTDELHEQQKQIRTVQQLQANSDKVEALGTLAAGTAHELATPLSTIAIVARDVEQAFEQHPPDFPGAEDVIDDVHLIRRELDRCRSIIDRMSSHAGESIGASIEKISIDDISRIAIEGVVEQGRIKLTLPSDADKQFLSVPCDALCQAIRALIQNGLDSDNQGHTVSMDVSLEKGFWQWLIRDQGTGMSNEQLKRVSEPFFTTKPPGKGMGLGVFLAKNVVGRLGGRIEFETRIGKGTTVTVLLPKSE